MKYELAKKLKDVGFKQRGKGTLIVIKSSAIGPTTKLSSNRSFYIPTLSELIKACGENFGHFDKEGESFVAFSVDGHSEDYNSSTPEEAVAHLWLRLNKKKFDKNLQEKYIKIPKDFFDKLDFKIKFDEASMHDIELLAMMESLKKKNQKLTNRGDSVDALINIVYNCYGQGMKYLEFNVGKVLDKILLEQKEEIKKEQFYVLPLEEKHDNENSKTIRNFLNKFYGKNRHS